MSDLQERVNLGCKLLDERLPAWDRKIDLAKLDLNSPCNCVLGQLCIDLCGPEHVLSPNPYLDAKNFLLSEEEPWEATAHGFTVDATRLDLWSLTQCWKQAILSRRAAS